MSSPTRDELEADIAFLLLRAGSAGSCSFTSDRWTGASSNSLVALAYGGEQTAMPHDRSDYAACVRTVKRLPSHRRTEQVLEALRQAKEHYLGRYPEDRYPKTREAQRIRYAQEREEWQRAERERRSRKRRRA